MSAPSLHWTLDRVAKLTAGRVLGDGSTGIDGVTTDSRFVSEGELFVAIRGERFDGHEFVADAMKAGARGAMVSAPVGNRPRVEVADTVVALRDLAIGRRGELRIPTVAVTGSSGKTSTKDLLAVVLPGAWASPRSYNNEIGVPLTVLSAPPEAEHLVLEVGSRGAGHIDWLAAAVRPDVAIITNLGVVHLETFGTIEVLASAKWELVEALDGGTAVLPDDEPALGRSHPGRTLRFGFTGDADVRVEHVTVDSLGLPGFVLRTPSGVAEVTLRIAGRHQALNAAAAAAAAIALDIPFDEIVAGLERAQGSPWRMEVHRGSFTVVNDTYNANPDSMEAALRTVADMGSRRIAVLGLMAELGPVSTDEHARIGALAKELGFSVVVVVGEDDGIAVAAGPVATSVEGPPEALEVLRETISPGDIVLVKASRSVGLEGLAHSLAEMAVA